MNEQPSPFSLENTLASVGVRRLTPENTTIFEGTFSLLHCAVRGDNLYRGVFAVLLFPVTYPNRFISLRYTGEKDKEHEIGIIEDLATFPEEAQHLIRRNLARHYKEYLITRIHRIRQEYGLLFFEVEADGHPASFVMPWRYDRAEEYGQSGKVLLDAFDNRYIIRDVNALSATERRMFTSFIYW